MQVVLLRGESMWLSCLSVTESRDNNRTASHDNVLMRK